MLDKKYEKMLGDYDKHCLRISRSGTININEKPADKVKRIERLLSSYKSFFEYFFPQYATVACAPYQLEVADMLIKNKQFYLLFEVFRSGGKTVHITMGIPLYLYFTGSLRYMIVMGQTERKAQRLLSGLQAQLKFNPRIINDFGTRFKFGDWAEGDFLTTDGARFRSFGFGQSPRGEQEEGLRPDYIVVDDCDTKKHLHNDEWMQEAEDFIIEDLIGCFDASPTATRRFAFANNNFHKNSLTNRIKKRFRLAIEKSKLMGTRKVHNIFSIPAVKDLVRFEPLWKAKTTPEFWKDLYAELGHKSFCREYMHVHVAEGKIFKPEHMQWKKMLPLKQYDGLCLYGDLSYKDAGDFKALILVGKIGREFHIIHTFLRQCSRADAAKWLYDLYEDKNLRNYNITYKIDGLFAQDEFVNDFDMEGDTRGYHIPVVADKRPKGNKEDRIESTLGYFLRRWMWFNKAERETVDQIELLDQLYAFCKGSGAHDDGPDALHGAIDQVNRSAFTDNFDPKITARGGIKNRY